MDQNETEERFSFERLEAYRVAWAALAKVLTYRERLRGLPGSVAGQLERAAVATVANICEGVGRVGLNDRKHKWAIARGEANEAAGHDRDHSPLLHLQRGRLSVPAPQLPARHLPADSNALPRAIR